MTPNMVLIWVFVDFYRQAHTGPIWLLQLIIDYFELRLLMHFC